MAEKHLPRVKKNLDEKPSAPLRHPPGFSRDVDEIAILKQEQITMPRQNKPSSS